MEEVNHEISGTEEILTASLIVQTRIYDALIVLLRNINPSEAEALVSAHGRGILLAPPPAFVQEAGDE